MQIHGIDMGRGEGGRHLAVFIISENCRYIPPNVSTSVFFQYYLDVEHRFKSFVATTATASDNFDHSLTHGIPTITLRFADPSKICVINMLRAST